VSVPAEATLLDVLIDGFEKNEVTGGFHFRELPLPDEESAIRKFEEFCAEATRWKGEPARRIEDGGRRTAAWPDLEVLQTGRGIMVRARQTGFHRWWHDPGVWAGDPLAGVWDMTDDRR